MKLKKSGPVWITIILVIIPLLVFLWVKQSGNFDIFFAWAQRNYWLFITVLFLAKVAAMVYPPLPGGLFTLGAIPVIGWVGAYVVDLLGSMVGSTVAYVIGRKYGYALLEKLFDEESLKRLQKIKVKNGRELESVFMLRTLGGHFGRNRCLWFGIIGHTI